MKVYLVWREESLLAAFSSYENASFYTLRAGGDRIQEKELDKELASVENIPATSQPCYKFSIFYSSEQPPQIFFPPEGNWEEEVISPLLSYDSEVESVVLTVPAKYGIAKATSIARAKWLRLKELLNQLSLDDAVYIVNSDEYK